jgi:hypothetical protein
MSGPDSITHPSQRYAELPARLDLVNRFNFFVGMPDAKVAEMQREFVLGELSDADLAAIVRLYEYILSAAEV